MVQYDWRPRIADGDAPLWRKLVDALASDVKLGKLQPGVRLPPHRQLAYDLGIGVGTVSKAYVEAERRGLVISHVGRGTFVAERPVSPVRLRNAAGLIDMARNVPPIAPALACLDPSLDELRLRRDVGALVDYSLTAGLDVVRDAGARWLRAQGRVERATAQRLIQTCGGQNALMLACSSFARTGDVILCDRATYPGNRTIAAHGGWHLRGVAADGQGMDPEALDRAAAETGAKLLILIPTLHNPTAITMPLQRRLEIREVARARDLLIIEDDIYRVFGRNDDPAPFAELAPERTIHVTGLSKALAPGLRLGFILPPDNDSYFDRLLLAAQATSYCPPAAGGLLFAQWMEDGLALRILDEVREEVRRRNGRAKEILGAAMATPDSPHSLHVWLPMEADRAWQVAAGALRANVEVTPPDAPFVDPADVSGLRLCLGTAADMDSLDEALQAVKAALDGATPVRRRAIL